MSNDHTVIALLKSIFVDLIRFLFIVSIRYLAPSGFSTMLKILKFVFIFLFSSHICIASRSLPEIKCEMNDIIKGHLRHLKENSKRLNQDLTELEQLETLADDHVFHSGILTQMKGLDKTTLMQMCYLIKTDFEGMLETHQDLNKNFYPNMVSEVSFNLENPQEFMRKY